MKVFQAMLELFATAIFFTAGLFFLVLPYQEALRLRLASALFQEPEWFTPAGIAFLFAAALLLLSFYFAQRDRFFVLRMGAQAVIVDPQVIDQTLRSLLHRQFLGKVALRDVEIGAHGNLEIGLLLASPESADKTLVDVEREFQVVLAKQFGYRRPFTVVVVESA